MKQSPRYIALLFLGISSAASGQAALLGPGAAYISIGGAHIATDRLDDRLKAWGYPQLGQSARSAGIGGYRILNSHWMLGAEITGVSTPTKARDTSEVTVAGGHATLGIGYMKQLSPRLRIYPRLGLGVGGITLMIETADTVPFDAVLVNPQPVTSSHRLLSRDGGVIDLGLGAEFLPKGGLLLGLRAGYLFAGFGDSNWWMQNGTATNGPKSSIAGPYLRLVLGGAWKR